MWVRIVLFSCSRACYTKCSGRPGGAKRFGPTHWEGEHRCAQIGSVRRFLPWVWMRNVMWLMKVMRRFAPSTRVGGASTESCEARNDHFGLGVRIRRQSSIALGAWLRPRFLYGGFMGKGIT